MPWGARKRSKWLWKAKRGHGNSWLSHYTNWSSGLIPCHGLLQSKETTSVHLFSLACIWSNLKACPFAKGMNKLRCRGLRKCWEPRTLLLFLPWSWVWQSYVITNFFRWAWLFQIEGPQNPKITWRGLYSFGTPRCCSVFLFDLSQPLLCNDRSCHWKAPRRFFHALRIFKVKKKLWGVSCDHGPGDSTCYISLLWIVMSLVRADTSSFDLSYQRFWESSERS